MQPEAFAIAGYGPQVFPYALVVTKRHITALGETSESERASVIACLRLLLEMNVFASHRLSVFEHGGRGEESCSCLEHCHLHVIDGRYPVDQWLREEETVRCQVSFDEAHGLQVSESYLFAGTYDGESLTGVIASPEERRSQYFRQLLATRIGERRWDWREGMNHQFILRLVAAAKHGTAST